jgi:perosamine synthetase
MTAGSLLAAQITDAIRTVVGTHQATLHEPHFGGNELVYLKECVDSTFVSSVGKFVDRFERDLAEYTGANHAIATVNGTAALHIALKLAGVLPSDEVLIPALTFVATANAVVYCNAVPHFIDSDKNTLGVDVAKLHRYLLGNTRIVNNQCVNNKTGSIIRAVVPMHTFGHPADMDALLHLAEEFNLTVVEDAAESLGSIYKGKHLGTFGRLGVLSFNGNKTITTGGGGAILTNDSGLAKRAKHLTTTAKLPHAWEYRHDEVGYNYRMPNINAALGCAQLEQLPRFISAQRELFNRYQNIFRNINGLNLMSEPQGCRSNFWLQTIVLDEEFSPYRDEILEFVNGAGFVARPTWVLMNLLQPFLANPAMDLSGAASLAERIINIPSSPKLILEMN